MEKTKIYLQTWCNYNNFQDGFGWMLPAEAKEFIKNSLEDGKFIEENGTEFFIADIDNYLGVDFPKLEYKNPIDIIETIEKLEDIPEYERNLIIAIMEYEGCDISEAIEKIDNYSYYENLQDYFDFCDEMIESEIPENMLCYFNYEKYHNDLCYDIYEAENGIILL